jgi:hypothetical protein
MADFRNYDPGLVVGSFRGIQILGLMDGTFITAERAEDAFSAVVGRSGDVTRVRNRNRTGTVTITLMAEAPTNDLLSAVAFEDEAFGTGVGPLLFKNLNGTTVIEAAQAWIQKLPSVEFSTDASGREWIFECAELIMNVGGAVV